MGEHTGDAVLVVDDDDEIRGALATTLAMDGYHVREARNGAHAIRVLRDIGAARPLAIVLDLAMPMLDGWQFRRTLAALPDCADVPVVVMSALPEDEARQGGLDGVEYLRKPFEVDALLAILSRLHPRRPA